jgi:peptidoglycan/xylan/chitin deacetylase (PgdA/CDA1 family)
MLQAIRSHGSLPRTLGRREFLGIACSLFLLGPKSPAFAGELEELVKELESVFQPQRGDSQPNSATHGVPGNDSAPLAFSHPLLLTFDDGPLPCTGRILDLLAAANYKATFFVIGRNLTNRKMRDVAIRALKEGHDLANHSYTHPNFAALSARRAEQEITATHKLIEDLVQEANVAPDRQNRFFRFPYGVTGSASNYFVCRRVLAELKYRIAGWDLDTNDWRMELGWFRTPSFKVVASLNKARPLDVVLLHDRVRTSQHLPAMLEVLDSQRLISMPLSDYDQSVASVGEKERERELDLVSPTRNRTPRRLSAWETEKVLPDVQISGELGPTRPRLAAIRHPLGTERS